MTPGVYIHEASGGVLPIEGADTATAAFVGPTRKGPWTRAVAVESAAAFEARYGGAKPGGWMWESVRGFFENGGKRLLIARLKPAARAAPDPDAYARALALLDGHAVGLVAAPGAGQPMVVAAGAAYCAARGGCLFVGDAGGPTDTPAEVRAFADAAGTSSYAAVYTPWLTVPAPGGGAPVAVPPSGAVAGVMARTDATQGVWKAPAGREAVVRGAVGVARTVPRAEQETLTARGVNVLLRPNATGGVVVWGARTLAASDPEFRYVPVRRTVAYVSASLTRGLAWTLFEPSDEPLWARMRDAAETFLTGLWRAGAFLGRTPREAFYVRTGRDTTTQADLDAGRLVVEVGVAPLRPAEFVIFRIGLWTARPDP